MPVYLRLLRLVRPYWRRLALAMSCMALIAAVTAATALLVKPVLDDVFFRRNWQMLVLLPLVVLALFLLKGLFLYGEEYFMGYVGQRVIADMRDRLYQHLQRLPVAFFTRTPTGVIISRITNDVNLIQAAVTNALTSVLKDLFTVVGLTGVLLYRDWQLALLAFVVLPFAGGFIVKVGRKLRRVSAETQTAMGSLSTRIHETATGTRIVKAFGMEAFESRRFAEENRQLFTLLMRAYKARALTSPAMELLAGIGVAFIIWYGGAKVMAGSHTP
ncbi:MAG: ABC transporter permease, partial [Deltaproteobacteria bacterium]|nr:ABC transporter permease [Deltaproteobacteria bacterium]